MIYLYEQRSAAAEHARSCSQAWPASFPPFHLDAKENMVWILLNRCGMVGVGLGASLKGGNQIWSKKKNTFEDSNYNELVDILSSWQPVSKANRKRCVVWKSTTTIRMCLLEHLFRAIKNELNPKSPNALIFVNQVFFLERKCARARKWPKKDWYTGNWAKFYVFLCCLRTLIYHRWEQAYPHSNRMQDYQDMWEKSIHPKYYGDVKVDSNQCYPVIHGLKQDRHNR